MTNNPTSRILIALTLIIIGLSNAQAGLLERLFAPKADAWTFWNESNEASAQKVDHTDWHRFLNKYIHSMEDGTTRLDYANVSHVDRTMLKNYVAGLESLPIRKYTRGEQRAYWINLYNAATVQTILEHYPIKSILDIDTSPGLFAKGPWGDKILNIENQTLSLNDIEHRILRPLWKDPRIHYALNCASVGCPNLQKSEFTVENTDVLLERAASEFINHPRGVSVIDGRLSVSSIYSWFRSDFGGNNKGVIQHLLEYAGEDLASELKQIKKVSKDNYDWAINEL